MPWVGFTFLMSHMSVSHIYRMYAASPSSVDITGAQMVLVMKLSAFCWNVWDGKQKEADLSPDQQSRAVKKLPSILNYAGFVAFFPSVMIGPAFDYSDYERWINTSMFDLPPGTDPLKAPPTRKKRKIPRSGTPATIKMLVGLAWTIAFLQLSAPTTAPATTSASAAQEEPAALLPSSQIPALLQSETLQPPPVADESAVPFTPGGEDVVALPEYLPEERK